jgi:hypothetical protein
MGVTVAFTACSASAVTILPFRPIWFSTALPSGLAGISAGGQSSSPASRLAAAGVANPARFVSHVPAATSGTPPSASLRPGQIVVFDGGGAGAAPAQVQAGQDRWRHVSEPASDRSAALHPGHDRRRGQRQHSRNRMIPALARPAIRHPGEQFRQLTAHKPRIMIQPIKRSWNGRGVIVRRLLAIFCLSKNG